MENTVLFQWAWCRKGVYKDGHESKIVRAKKDNQWMTFPEQVFGVANRFDGILGASVCLSLATRGLPQVILHST
jgi:hypothetical protein